jgi:hypothetical protein
MPRHFNQDLAGMTPPMTQHRILTWLFAVVCSAYSATAQQMPAANSTRSLLGTWRLVEDSDWDSAGTLIQNYGPNPTGYFVYDPTGHVSIQIMRMPPVPPFAAGPDSASDAELRKLFDSYVGYFGTYTVDSKRSVIVHHVEGGTLPNYIGTDQVRPFRLAGDSLIIGDGKTWRRLLLRVH